MTSLRDCIFTPGFSYFWVTHCSHLCGERFTNGSFNFVFHLKLSDDFICLLSMKVVDGYLCESDRKLKLLLLVVVTIR